MLGSLILTTESLSDHRLTSGIYSIFFLPGRVYQMARIIRTLKESPCAFVGILVWNASRKLEVPVFV